MLDRTVAATIIKGALPGEWPTRGRGGQQPNRRSFLYFENRHVVQAVRLSRLREPGQEAHRPLLQHSLLRPGPGPAGAPATPGAAGADRAARPSALHDLSGSSRHRVFAGRPYPEPGGRPGRSAAPARRLIPLCYTLRLLKQRLSDSHLKAAAEEVRGRKIAEAIFFCA